MKVNDWNSQQVSRAETTWGHKFPLYTKSLFDAAIDNCVLPSFLDLGCGFGRFLQYLTEHIPHQMFKYTGYDSSSSMIQRISERFPQFKNCVFERSLTDPIIHQVNSIIASAVFIHLPLEDQATILYNIRKMDELPNFIGFDINCPSESFLSKQPPDFTHYERIISLDSQPFRMTWQSPTHMEELLNEILDTKYDINSTFFSLYKDGRSKRVFKLTKKD